MIATNLDSAIRSVCPLIDGVSLGRTDDKSTWRIQFQPAATAQQRTDAASVLAAFDPVAKTPAELRDDIDAAESAAAKVDATILALVNATPAQLVTFARNNFPSLTLAEQNRIGLILNILAVAVRPHVRG